MSIDQLLSAHLELVGADVERWLQLFADDAVVEFPYAGSLGGPTRLAGRDAIHRHFSTIVPQFFKDLVFSNVRRYPSADPAFGMLEVHGAATILPTGNRYEQDYLMLARAVAGRLVFYREYWDPLVAARAFGMAVTL